MATIQRTGVVYFGDASLSVWEDGIAAALKAGGLDAVDAWKLEFKRGVFARIVQQLNRFGWTCEIPEDYIKKYSTSFARNFRRCHKGELKGWLEITGRCINFEEPKPQRHDRCTHPSGPHPMNEWCEWKTPKTEGAPE